MLLQIDSTADEPIYMQIRDQVVAGIALGELTPGMQLPSVRSLGADLGVNLHTVNKAYAVLRDEGYIHMKGRSGAFIAEPDEADQSARTNKAHETLESELFQAALTFRANGGERGAFLEAAAVQAARAYGVFGQEDLASHSSWSRSDARSEEDASVRSRPSSPQPVRS